MQRIAAATVLGVVAGLAVGAPASAAGELRTVSRDGSVVLFQRVATAATPVTGTGATRSDFDGDGVDDVAANADIRESRVLPYEPFNAVVVRYSSAPQVDYLAGGGHPELGGGFLGGDLVAGDFDGDGYDDLAVGDPYGVDSQARTQGGAVWVFPGSRTGLVVDAAQRFTQGTAGVPGDSEVNDSFGVSLAAGDLNGDGRDDLAVGAPAETVGTKESAGAVTVLFGGAGGLTGTGAQRFDQDQGAVPGAAEPYDKFGLTVAIGRVDADRYADLVIGAPWENDGDPGVQGSGMVTLMGGSENGVRTTGATSVTGAGVHARTGDPSRIVWHLGLSLAVGDANGDGLGEVIAGAPYAQDRAGVRNAGLVVAFTGRSAGLSGSAATVIHQGTPGVPGDPESGDLFGASLAMGDVTGDGRAEVLVGAPGEAIGTVTEAGMVTLLKGSAGGLTGTGSQGFDQGHPVVPGSPERGDGFGGALALLNLDGTGGLDAAVAASREEVTGDPAGTGSGMVVRFHGSTGGLVPQAGSWSGRSLDTDLFSLSRYGNTIVGPQSGGVSP